MQLSSKLKKMPSSIVFLTISLVVISLVLVVILLTKPKSENAPIPITEDQIEIRKGDDYMIVNKNGLIEYHSKDKVYYENWDSGRIADFFANIQDKAKKAQSGGAKNTNCVYEVMLFLDGKFVKFCTDETDTEVAQTYESVASAANAEDLTSSFEDGSSGGGSGSSDISNYFSSPTPTIYLSPTPYVSSGNNTNYPPVAADCSTWAKDIVGGKAVISNTLCTTSPTPAP